MSSARTTAAVDRAGVRARSHCVFAIGAWQRDVRSEIDGAVRGREPSVPHPRLDDCDLPPMPVRAMKVLGPLSARWLLLAASVVIACALGEFGYRQIVRAQYRAQVAAFRDELVELAPGHAYVYRSKPDLVWREEVKDPAGGPPAVFRYTTNHDGWRTHREWPPSERPGAQRILFLGDSYTWGIAVQDGESWPFLVEALLRARGIDAVAIDAGVPGYDSEQEAALLAELLPRYRPAAVVLGFVMNDLEPVMFAPVPPEQAYRTCWSWLFEDSKGVLSTLGVLAIDDGAFLHIEKPVLEPDYPRALDPGRPEWPRTRAALLSIHAQCRAAGVPLLVPIFPDFTKPFDPHGPLRVIHAHVRAVAAAAGFRALDLMPTFAGADHLQLWVPGDGHPGAEGHRRFAAAIAPVVAELLGRG
jgi:lysophospholipase L1-like esterase